MIKPWQLRAMREACGWSQGQLAKKSGLTQPSISALEKGSVDNPNSQTISSIVSAFEAEGFFFTENGIEHRTTNTYTIEGEDCYLRLLDDAEKILPQTKGEILFSGANERRSPDIVIEKFNNMRKQGIKMRSLIEANDNYVMGDLNEYRWMPKNLFVDGDVKIIYADKVAYLVSWLKIPKIIFIQDKVIAEEARRQFNYIWERLPSPKKTTSPKLYEDVNG